MNEYPIPDLPLLIPRFCPGSFLVLWINTNDCELTWVRANPALGTNSNAAWPCNPRSSFSSHSILCRAANANWTLALLTLHCFLYVLNHQNTRILRTPETHESHVRILLHTHVYGFMYDEDRSPQQGAIESVSLSEPHQTVSGTSLYFSD